MKILYQDEYGVELHEDESDAIPRVGDNVLFNTDEYRVKSVTWVLAEKLVIIEITDNLVKKSKEENDSDSRLNEIKSAIVGITQRQDKQEKKSRLLSEQLVSVRTHLRTKK